jgi:hypothetical protein
VLVMFMGLMLLHQTQTTLAAYVLNDNFQGPSFWDNFWFWNQADPAGGYVSYQARQEAANQNLIQVSENNTVIIAVDTTNIAGAAGRNAVRLQSNKNWNSGLFVLDFVHMPTGCGTWPAWWFNGPNPWPTGGEVDVIEGVNTQTATQSTLHTTQGCTMPIAHQNVFSGDWVSGTNGQPANDCFIDAPTQWANQGCGVLGPANGYGAPSNAGRGGVYAMEWTSEYFQMFYFPRNRIPADLTSNAPIPTNWGLPYARFPLSASCPANKFQNLNMILNTDFCGGWAGGLFAQTCPGLGGDCNAYVKNNPCAFTQAYWEINYIRVFQQNNVAGPSRSPQPVPSVPPTRSKAPNACTP